MNECNENYSIEAEIADTLIGMPTNIQINGRHFYFYPPSLGVMMLTSRLVKSLEMDEEVMHVNPVIEALRQVTESRAKVARIVAVSTARKKDEAFSESLIDKRAKVFSSLTDEDLAQLFLFVIHPPTINEIMKRSGIQREHELMQKAVKAKKDKGGTLSFGGLTIYGKLIDRACERYGWTIDHTVWEVSYASLQLLLADSPQSVYLTEKERRDAGIPLDRQTIKADDKRNNARIAEMFHQGKN